jgi:uncharacterized delta-60 repeat protein
MTSFLNERYIKGLLILSVASLIFIAQALSQTMFLDKDFGNGGKVLSHIKNTNVIINDVAIQSDQKIVVAGTLYDTRFSPYSSMSQFLVVRYNANGTIDSSFGVDGAATKDIGVNTNDIRSIAIQPDGKIVAGGTIQLPYSHDTHFALVRFNSNGLVDSTFGTNGLVTTTFQINADIHEDLERVIIKPDGKILAGGYSYDHFNIMAPTNVVISQYNSNGTIDSSFGTNGKVISSTGSPISYIGFTMVLRADSKIVAGGPHINKSFAPMQFNANGMRDSTFGVNGFGDTITSFVVRDQIMQPDGKIVYTGNRNSEMVVLIRYNSNGTFDSTFGNNGKVVSNITTLGEDATSLHLGPNGKFLVTGYVNQSAQSGSNFALIQYNSNGTIDTTFGEKGLVTTDFNGYQDVSHASVIQPDGKIVLAGFSRDSLTRYTALARYSYSVMPLKLTSFTANKEAKANVLHWSTEEEINIAKFEIERSNNGREYSSIGKVNAGLSRYNYTDINPLKGSNYYRLKVIDKDGRFDYSPVRISNNNSNINVRVYPVPVKGTLNLQMYSSKAEKAEITVTDISGKTVRTASIALVAGANSALINVQMLSKGTYFLKVVTSEGSNTKKIVVD